MSAISIVILLAIFLSFTVAIIAWRFRQNSPATWPLVILMLLVCVWLISYYLELSSLNLYTSIIMAKFQYIGIAFCPTLFLIFAITYYKNRFVLNRRHLILLGVIPLTTLILALTNETHDLIWTQYTTVRQASITLSYPEYGIWFWFYIAYSYLMLSVSSFLLIKRAYLTSNTNRWQATTLLLAVLAPWISNILYAINVTGDLDPTPVSFAISGMALWVGIFRFRLLNILPAAQAAVISNMQDGILVLDHNDLVVDYNLAAANLFGIETNSVSEKKVDDIVAQNPEWKGALLDNITMGSTVNITKGGKNLHYSTKGSRIDFVKDGKSYHYDVVSSPIGHGSRTELGRVLLFHDITEKIEALNELHDSWAKELEAKISLEQEIEARSLFINVLAHELKTPMTPQIAAIELLKDTYEKDKGSNEYRLINLVANGAQSLNDILSNLLDLAAFRDGTIKISRKTVSLKDVIEQVVDQFGVLANQQDQSITLDMAPNLPKVKADIGRIKQVLGNLIANSIKFNSPESEVLIWARVEDNELVVGIEDHGEGISPEQQERIFKPYHRTEQDRQIFHGLGLGLAIAKQIVESHDGRIWVNSEQGKGSTFGFSLPLS